MLRKWLAGGFVPPLEAGAVQVWWLDLAEPRFVPALTSLLSPAELARAERTKAGAPREEFIAARGALRLLLAAATAQAPQQVAFEIGEQGKPMLAGRGVDFNVSHAGGCALLAISRAGSVGVDVEPCQRTSLGIDEAMELARANFHQDEIAAVDAEATDAQRLAMFYRCWTRKEAVVKADGRGLYVPLADFCVLDKARDVPIKVPGGHLFWLHDVCLNESYTAALAVPEWEIPVTFNRFLPGLCC